MLSNRRSLMGPPSAVNMDKPPGLCNPRPTWRRTSTSVIPPSYSDATVPGYNSSTPGDQPHCSTPSVLTSTTPAIAGYRITKVVGSAYGSTTAHLPKDGAKLWLKAVCGMGGEVRNLTNVIYAARDTATERMVLDCVTRGGNAIVGLSYTETEVMGCLAVSVQGTIVYVESTGNSRGIAEDPFQGGA